MPMAQTDRQRNGAAVPLARRRAGSIRVGRASEIATLPIGWPPTSLYFRNTRTVADLAVRYPQRPSRSTDSGAADRVQTSDYLQVRPRAPRGAPPLRFVHEDRLSADRLSRSVRCFSRRGVPADEPARRSGHMCDRVVPCSPRSNRPVMGRGESQLILRWRTCSAPTSTARSLAPPATATCALTSVIPSREDSTALRSCQARRAACPSEVWLHVQR